MTPVFPSVVRSLARRVRYSLSRAPSVRQSDFILVSIKKLEKLFIAPKARLRLHETV